MEVFGPIFKTDKDFAISVRFFVRAQITVCCSSQGIVAQHLKHAFKVQQHHSSFPPPSFAVQLLCISGVLPPALRKRLSGRANHEDRGG